MNGSDLTELPESTLMLMSSILKTWDDATDKKLDELSSQLDDARSNLEDACTEAGLPAKESLADLQQMGGDIESRLDPQQEHAYNEELWKEVRAQEAALQGGESNTSQPKGLDALLAQVVALKKEMQEQEHRNRYANETMALVKSILSSRKVSEAPGESQSNVPPT